MRNQIVQGDCLAELKKLPDNSIDSCVVDPPYGLGEVKDIAGLLQAWMNDLDDSKYVGKSGFMGAAWDSAIPGPRYWKEVLRCLKPGAHILAFAGTRTYDLLVIALRLAGFQVRDQIEWVYGSGMPKSLDISKQIDKMKNAKREVIGRSEWYGRNPNGRKNSANENRNYGVDKRTDEECNIITAPATPEAEQWQGWGSNLKPGHEPICLARKPLAEDTIAANVLEYGTGALNIDASRIGDGHDRASGGLALDKSIWGSGSGERTERPTGGRWPSNFLLSHTLYCQPNGLRKVKGVTGGTKPMKGNNIYGPVNPKPVFNYANDEGLETVEDYICTPDCPVRLLDEQSGIRPTRPSNSGNGSGEKRGLFGLHSHVYSKYYDTGTASRYFMRFFYTSKASKSERSCNGTVDNNHCTVKPINLLRYLVRMITPPGGIVLDCFAGSGTTALACIAEGFDYLIIEQSSEYCAIAEARVQHALAEVA